MYIVHKTPVSMGFIRGDWLAIPLILERLIQELEFVAYCLGRRLEVIENLLLPLFVY